MIVINGLKEVPKNCRNAYEGKIIKHDCPCFHNATMDGPAYCTIIALIRHDSFDALPSKYGCPLKRV